MGTQFLLSLHPVSTILHVYFRACHPVFLPLAGSLLMTLSLYTQIRAYCWIIRDAIVHEDPKKYCLDRSVIFHLVSSSHMPLRFIFMHLVL